MAASGRIFTQDKAETHNEIKIKQNAALKFKAKQKAKSYQAMFLEAGWRTLLFRNKSGEGKGNQVERGKPDKQEEKNPGAKAKIYSSSSAT